MTSAARNALRVLAVVLGGGWLFLAFVAGSFIGWSSETLGWLWSGIAFGSGLALAVLLWRPRDRRWPLVAVGVVSLVLGFVHWQSSPPTHDRIAGHADEVELPAEWELVYDSDYGNTWCFKGCPWVERSYRVPGSYDDAVADVEEAFEEAGWTSGGAGPYDTWSFSDGRWRATLTERYPEDEPPTEIAISFSG